MILSNGSQTYLSKNATSHIASVPININLTQLNSVERQTLSNIKKTKNEEARNFVENSSKNKNRTNKNGVEMTPFNIGNKPTKLNISTNLTEAEKGKGPVNNARMKNINRNRGEVLNSQKIIISNLNKYVIKDHIKIPINKYDPMLHLLYNTPNIQKYLKNNHYEIPVVNNNPLIKWMSNTPSLNKYVINDHIKIPINKYDPILHLLYNTPNIQKYLKNNYYEIPVVNNNPLIKWMSNTSSLNKYVINDHIKISINKYDPILHLLYNTPNIQKYLKNNYYEIPVVNNNPLIKWMSNTSSLNKYVINDHIKISINKYDPILHLLYNTPNIQKYVKNNYIKIPVSTDIWTVNNGGTISNTNESNQFERTNSDSVFDPDNTINNKTDFKGGTIKPLFPLPILHKNAQKNPQQKDILSRFRSIFDSKKQDKIKPKNYLFENGKQPFFQETGPRGPDGRLRKVDYFWNENGQRLRRKMYNVGGNNLNLPNSPWPIIALGSHLKTSEQMQILLMMNKVMSKFNEHNQYKFVKNYKKLGPALIHKSLITSTNKNDKCSDLKDKLQIEFVKYYKLCRKNDNLNNQQIVELLNTLF